MHKSIEPLEKRLLLSTTLRIDAGSQTPFLDSNGFTWAADNGFTGGTVSTKPYAVGGTVDDPLYITRRLGNMSYALPVDNGAYTLSLYFAEPVMTGKGQRKFNVFAEGGALLTNSDLFAAAGTHNALVKSFPIDISDSVLNLKFVTVVNNAIISGIELVPRAPSAIRVNTGGPAQTVDGNYWYAGNTTTGPWGEVAGGFVHTESPVPAITGVVSPADAAIYPERMDRRRNHGSNRRSDRLHLSFSRR